MNTDYLVSVEKCFPKNLHSKKVKKNFLNKYCNVVLEINANISGLDAHVDIGALSSWLSLSQMSIFFKFLWNF